MSPYDAYVYTTGRIATICKVAPRTVSKWIDSERLPGYRIPGSNDRRVLGSTLRQFMMSSGMGALLPAELRQESDVAVFGYALPGQLIPCLGAVPGARILHTQFGLALALAELRNYPVTVYIGTEFGISAATEVALAILESRISIDEKLARVVLIRRSEDEEPNPVILDKRARYALCDSAEQFNTLLNAKG